MFGGRGLEEGKADPNPIEASGGRELRKVKTLLFLQVRPLCLMMILPESGGE
jgi:hypothetical protein